MEHVGPELNRFGNVFWRVEFIEMMLLAGSGSLFILKYATGVSPTN
jgi:hypothetical protein